MTTHGWRWTTGILVAVTAWSSPTARALEPEDVAVVFNTRSPTSLSIARHYLKARGIPETRLIPLTCDAAENIPEAQYRTSVVPQLLAQLRQRKLLPDQLTGSGGIKCLVTTWDVPLRILPYEPPAAQRTEITNYRKRLESLTEELAGQIAAYEQLAAATGSAPASRPASAPATAAAAKPTLQQVLSQLNTAYAAAARRIDRLAEPARAEVLRQFIALQQKVTGPAGLLATLRAPADAPEAEVLRRQLAQWSDQVRVLQQQYQDLARQREVASNRQQMIVVRTQSEGLVGEVRALTDLLAYLNPEQTSACFDNELALLLTEQSYSRANWMANPNHLETYPLVTRTAAAAATPVLLVARLDGSSEAKVKQMIDTTLKVEAQGLEGKFYLDARGLRGTDAYSAFDADLRRTADWMKQHATMQVILDDKPELLEAKDCPAAALYCGWYSLHNYKESCQWLPGAVGYHVASGEMESLHNPGEKGWVVNLLNAGFCGTMGPTDEPYLHSFPKPSLFFPLLMCGEFTQGEVWQVTAPLLSWRVGFVGDPLYNPFKKKPAVKTETLKADPVLRRAWEILAK